MRASAGVTPMAIKRTKKADPVHVIVKVDGRRWRRVLSLSGSRSDDRHYVLETRPNGSCDCAVRRRRSRSIGKQGVEGGDYLPDRRRRRQCPIMLTPHCETHARSGFVGGDPQPHSRHQFRRLTLGDPNLCLLRSRGSDSNWLECARELPNNRIQPTAFGRG